MKTVTRPAIRQMVFLLIALSRTIITIAFWIATRISFRIQVRGQQHDKRLPSTYFGMAHRRDLDPIILIPIITFFRGWSALSNSLHFALRGDAFSPGFLARIVMEPRFIARFLRPINAGTVLPWLGALPLESLFRPTEEWIRELLRVSGDARAGDLLAPMIIYELAHASGESYEQIAGARLSQLLAWRYQAPLQHFYSSEIILGPARRKIDQRLVARMKQQIIDLGAWLQSGGSVLGSPEGQLSPDGTFRPINSALHRILRYAPASTTILPWYPTYDYMTTRRRISVFIEIGTAIENAPTLSKEQLEQQLYHSWIQAARFTCSLLASGFVMEASRAERSFTLDELSVAIHRQALSLAEAGRHVDRQLLHPGQARKLAARFLAYARRHHLVYRSGPNAWAPSPTHYNIKVRPMEVIYDMAPLLYCWNELQALLGEQGGMEGPDDGL
ncbi:MAG TPA: hypothetical protein VFA09_11080 [Ktedonobacteraceae bacterium]|nr:hypothetical protein [Ktedonobacteraceae bacterium]